MNTTTDNVTDGVNSIENNECPLGRVTLVIFGERSQVRGVRPVVVDNPSFREFCNE
jgi:hypothetical protein